MKTLFLILARHLTACSSKLIKSLTLEEQSIIELKNRQIQLNQSEKSDYHELFQAKTVAFEIVWSNYIDRIIWHIVQPMDFQLYREITESYEESLALIDMINERKYYLHIIKDLKLNQIEDVSDDYADRHIGDQLPLFIKNRCMQSYQLILADPNNNCDEILIQIIDILDAEENKSMI